MYYCECKNGNLETIAYGTTLTQMASDQGGGVGGVNYTEYANGNELNYKICSLRGDVIKPVKADKTRKSFSYYYAFGNHNDVYGSTPTDDFRANTKVEDDHDLLNEGKRSANLNCTFENVFLFYGHFSYLQKGG